MSSLDTFKCIVCNFDINNLSLPPCGCNTCTECIYEWIKQNNNDSLQFIDFITICPNATCKKPISEDWLDLNLGKDEKTFLNELKLKKYLNCSEDTYRCPKGGCDYAGFFNSNNSKCQIDNTPFTCEICNYNWLAPGRNNSTGIKDNSHFLTSYVYEFKNKFEGFLEELSELRISLLTRPCVHCQRNVYKYTGCAHISCVCKKEFCYICLGDWSNHNSIRCGTKSALGGMTVVFIILTLLFKIVFSIGFIYTILSYLVWLLYIEGIGLATYAWTGFVAYQYTCFLLSTKGIQSYNIYRPSVHYLMNLYNNNIIARKLILSIPFLAYFYGVYYAIFKYETLYFAIKIVFFEAVVVGAICIFVYILATIHKYKKQYVG